MRFPQKLFCFKPLCFGWSKFTGQNLYAMKKKIFTLLLSVIMISAGTTAQTIKDKIGKAINDKNAKDNSAKADVYIIKKIISDTTQSKAQTKAVPVKTVIKTPGISKVKHKKRKDKLKLKKYSK